MALDCLEVLLILTWVLVLLSWFWDKFLTCVLIEVAVMLTDISMLYWRGQVGMEMLATACGKRACRECLLKVH